MKEGRNIGGKGDRTKEGRSKEKRKESRTGIKCNRAYLVVVVLLNSSSTEFQFFKTSGLLVVPEKNQ